MKTERLIDLCVGKGEYGIAASAEAYSESKYRYLRITDISDYGELLYNDKKSVSVAGCASLYTASVRSSSRPGSRHPVFPR